MIELKQTYRNIGKASAVIIVLTLIDKILAVVKEIAESYGGHLEIGRSELGGAKFCVRISSSQPASG